jgi:transposase
MEAPLMKINKIDHFGKTIYVGIDVHKKTYTLCAIGTHMPDDKISRLPASPKALVKTLQKRYAGAKLFVAYEAGFSGFVLYRTLVEAGINCIVVNPASIEIAANNRVKNDKRDAKKIALQLSRGQLDGIYVPDLEEEINRQLTRTRAQLVKQKTRTGNQIKSKLLQFGFIEFDDEREMSLKLLKEYLALSLPKPLFIAISTLADLYRTIHDQIKNIEKDMEKQAEKDSEIEAIYRSFPGVGPVSARTLSVELRDMSFIENQKAAYALTGMTPSEYSSGEVERKGHITRQGRACIRHILIEVAWRAIKDDDYFCAVYDRLKPKIGGKRAIVAVARRMIGKMRGCLQAQTLYQAGYGL